MTKTYIAYPWPEYQEYMGEEWFREECYYCADKDIYFIPINRVNTTSTDNGLGIYDSCIPCKTNQNKNIIKTYTDLKQSKTLEEILPLESADLYYKYGLPHFIKRQGDYESIRTDKYHDYIPYWSLVALLNVLPLHFIVNNQRYAFSMLKGLDKNGETYAIEYAMFNSTVYLHLTNYYNNPVDACYEMILKLYELKIL